VKNQGIPVVFVHGWNSHPGIWNRLIRQIESPSVSCWNFNHSLTNSAPLSDAATMLHDYIVTMRTRIKYSGPIDIVCHSMGTCIARYMLEVLEKNAQDSLVRQLIGIGPPNNGSSLAELFMDPVRGPQIVDRLAGVFVPDDFDPADDVTVQEFRPGSPAMTTLRHAGIRDDTRYRIILGSNTTATPAFFPWFEGKTWDRTPAGGWHMTYEGDGIVSHRDSYLPGASVEILPVDPVTFSRAPDQYCHIHLPRNPEVVDRVCRYLETFSINP
jgi:triacylglycerol lipase